MCMVEMAIFNIQRAITLKLGKQELRLMCSACHLMVLTFVSSFMKICFPSHFFKIMEWTQKLSTHKGQ